MTTTDGDDSDDDRGRFAAETVLFEVVTTGTVNVVVLMTLGVVSTVTVAGSVYKRTKSGVSFANGLFVNLKPIVCSVSKSHFRLKLILNNMAHHPGSPFINMD